MFVLANINDGCNGLSSIVAIATFIFKIIQWVVPILLIIFGAMDLVKAITKGKEDDIKKGQQILIKRAIAAVIVFLIPTLINIIMTWVGSTEWKTCWKSAYNKGITSVFEKLN